MNRSVILDCGAVLSGSPETIAMVLDIQDDLREREAARTELLRVKGVAASHPDDGWVKRNDDATGTVQFMYPHFNDGLDVGSLVALVNSVTERWRIVCLAKKLPPSPHFFGDEHAVWHYEPVWCVE